MLDQLTCAIDDENALNCTHLPWGDNDCSFWEAVILNCSNTALGKILDTFHLLMLSGPYARKKGIKLQTGSLRSYFSGARGQLC